MSAEQAWLGAAAVLRGKDSVPSVTKLVDMSGFKARSYTMDTLLTFSRPNIFASAAVTTGSGSGS